MLMNFSISPQQYVCISIAEKVLVKTKLSGKCVLCHQNNNVPGHSKYLIVSVTSISILSTVFMEVIH